MNPPIPPSDNSSGADKAADQNGSNPVTAKIENAAHAAHRTTDMIADKATAQVDRLSGGAHRAVNRAADAAAAAAQWASGMQGQARQWQDQFSQRVSTSVRGRPIAALAAAAVIGYFLGRCGACHHHTASGRRRSC